MHICQLAGEYPNRWGGLGTAAYNLSKALASKGHKITVITRKGGGKYPEIEGVDVIEVKWAKLPMEFTRSFGRWALKSLQKLHRNHPVDIIHFHAPLIAWNEKQFRKANEIAPIITSLHGSWLGEKRGLQSSAKFGEPGTWGNVNDIGIRMFADYYAKFENIAINNSEVCVANSIATKNDFISNYEPPSNWNCESILWGIDAQLYRPMHHDSEDDAVRASEIRKKYTIDSNANIILAVGRLAARKGHGFLISSFAELLEKLPNSHLVIIGRGNLRKKLLRKVKQLSIQDSVSILGGMSFEKIAEWYRISSVIAYPSFYEGQGLIPLESMASGTPCIAFDMPPLTEMLDENVGGLCEINIKSLADSMFELLSSKDLNKLGSAGRHRVLDKFTIEGNANDFISIYEKVISNTKI